MYKIDDKDQLYESISSFIYNNYEDNFFKDNIRKIDLKSFLSIDIKKNNSKDNFFFVNTNFILSKQINISNISSYNELLKRIKYNLDFLNSKGIKVIFDYLPLRFFGKKYLSNNYFFSNFNEKDNLDFFFHKYENKKKYEKNVSIQVLISRLDFLDDVFNSIINQSKTPKEIFLFVNFKDKKHVIEFEKKFLNFFTFLDSNIILLYSINELSESQARSLMPIYSYCQYILPLDDDDFLDVSCIFECEDILEKYGNFSMIKGLFFSVNQDDKFGYRYDIGNRITDDIAYELIRRKGKFLLPQNIASVDQLYVYNCDLLDYYGVIVPENLINNTGIEIELFLKSEEVGGYFLIEKVLYFKRGWNNQVTKTFSFQKELLIYLFNLIEKVILYRNIQKYVRLDIFPELKVIGNGDICENSQI